MKKTNPRIVFVWITISVFVIQCSYSERALLPGSVLWDNPCELPCWYNIVPSETRYSDVIVYLRKIDFVDIASLHEEIDDVSGTTHVNWKMKAPYAGWGTIVVKENMVESITVTGKFDITLKQIVNHYGPPEAYRVDPSGGEIAAWEYDFYYPHLGAVFEASYKAMPGLNVPPPVYAEAQIWNIELMKRGTLKEMLERLFGKYPDSLYRWQGFTPLPTPTLVGN